MEKAVGLLVPLGFFAMVVLVVWIIARAREARNRNVAEVQSRLLDKFSSGKELSDFLATEPGQKLLRQLGSQREHGREAVLGTVRAGIVVTALGLALFTLVTLSREAFLPGAIVSAIGVGLLLAAWVSHRLSKKWGMYEGGESDLLQDSPGPDNPISQS